MSYGIVEVKSARQFQHLEKTDALTVEGLIADDDSFCGLEDFLAGHDAIDGHGIDEFWIIKGADMNAHYGLTGDNAYPDNLTIVNIPLDQITNITAIALPMREFGGRWYSDVVDNNLRREQ